MILYIILEKIENKSLFLISNVNKIVILSSL